MPLLPPRIDAVTLAAKQFRRTVDFYEDVFGFEKVSESDIVARFRLKNIFLDIIKSEVLLEETHLERSGDLPGPMTLAITVRGAGGRGRVHAPDRGCVRPDLEFAAAEDKPSGPRILYAADPEGHIWEIGWFPTRGPCRASHLAVSRR